MKGMAITRNPLNFNKYQFLNRETQFETGHIDLRNRQYDPPTGRFTSQDPVIEGQEHLSLYQYGWNNPVLRSDADGLMPCCGETNDYDESMKSALPDMSHKAMLKGMEQMVGTMLGFTDANDAAVLVTSITRGGNGINFDGSKASGVDKGFALLGAIIPAVSGSAVKKMGGVIVDAVVNVVKGGEKTMETSKAARREVMRDVGIPTSQPLIPDKATKSTDKIFLTRDGKKTVQNAKNDVSHQGEPHWEAGPTKQNVNSPDGLNRSGSNNKPQMAKPKSKVYYNE